MPVAATGVDVSLDGQYIFATGVYKPRVRCYDVNHLSMKFERCLDAEVVHFSILSEDYTKVKEERSASCMFSFFYILFSSFCS